MAEEIISLNSRLRKIEIEVEINEFLNEFLKKLMSKKHKKSLYELKTH